MKYCPYCGSGLKENMMFCPKCGKAFEDATENPNMVDTDIDESIDAVEQEFICQEEQNIAEESAENTELEDKETIEVESVKETYNNKKKRKLWPFVLTMCVLFVIMAEFFFVMRYKENITNGKISSEFITNDANNSTSTLRELTSNEIATFSNSVLTLYVYDESGELLSSGSGFIAFDDKTIITNYHVIDKGYSVEAFSEDGSCYDIDGVSFYDDGLDIAILHFEKGTGIKPLSIADSSSVKVGDTVYAIGSPLGLSNTLSNGLVSAIREEKGYTDIQITAPISSGSSGGALFNVYGQVIGITYASYSEGQNLNLAIPSNEFSDKLKQASFQEFTDILLFEKDLGNTTENYSAAQTRLVQYGKTIYECYNSDNEIFSFDCDTGVKESLGLYGTNLSCYKNVLYFLPVNGDAICTYNLVTGEFNKNILLDYPKDAQTRIISKFFVSDSGISVISRGLIQLGFDNTIVGVVKDISSDVVIVDEEWIVATDYENYELDFVSLYDCETFSVSLDFEPSFVFSSGGYLYITDSTSSQYGSFARYDLATGNIEKFELPKASTYGCYVDENYIYYPTNSGTNKVSINGDVFSTITKKYELTELCFSDDYIYAIGKDPSADFARHTKYYIRIDKNGSKIEELDRKQVDWLNGVY